MGWVPQNRTRKVPALKVLVLPYCRLFCAMSFCDRISEQVIVDYGVLPMMMMMIAIRMVLLLWLKEDFEFENRLRRQGGGRVGVKGSLMLR